MNMKKQFTVVQIVLLIGVLLTGCSTPQPDEHATAVPAPTDAIAVPSTVAAPTATDAASEPAQEPTKPAAPTAVLELSVSAPENLSAGDPYAPELGNAGYDVQHYTLALALDPSAPFVDARVTIDAVNTMDGLDQVSLDFVGFDISEVSWDGTVLPFFREETKLIVAFPEPLPDGESFALDIAYSGEPIQEASDYVPFISHLGLYYPSGDSLFVVSEPDGARYWFPSNDHPRDKATYRFELSVPKGLTGVANGVLVEANTGGATGDLYVWEHDYPMATALVTVAVGDYVRLESASPDGVPLRHYVFPDRQADFERVEARLGEMIDWMSALFGPYPFEAFGFVTVSGLGASLETQTMVILSEGSIEDGTMSHEMAHMWFGDWVNLDSWQTMWRNEGFATYISIMWQLRDTQEDLNQRMAEITRSVLDNDSGYPLNDPPPAQLFGNDSYVKGAVVAHALRQEVGDEAFFGGLRTYFERYGGGTASDAEFQAVMEEAAGVSLDAFFAEWFE
ncbi:MAG: hypothetical protein GY832_07930 [Chloroflexi bacterium]|nr:hypothetical protein [Chloroflexota bacterium]